MSLGSLCQETPVGSPKPQRTGGRVTAPAGASQEVVGLWDSFPHSRASLAEPGGKACVSPGAGAAGRRPGAARFCRPLLGVAGERHVLSTCASLSAGQEPCVSGRERRRPDS